MLNFIKKYWAEIILGILIFSYAAYFSYFTILRHQSLYSGYFDLGIMDQAVYNTSQGRFLEITNPDGLENFKRMAIHNDLILAFFAPLYYLHAGPETLLIIQSIVLALGALPLFLLAKKIIGSRLLALILSFSYLIYMPLQRVNIFDFHSVSLAVTFLLFIFYFVEQKKYFWAAFFVVLTLLTKEQVGLTLAFYAVYLLLNKEQKNKIFAWTVLAISIIWFALSIWVVMPYFRQSQHFALSYYGDFGDKPEKILLGVLTHPNKLLNYFLQPNMYLYLFYLFAPLVFIPLLSPGILLVVFPEFAINFLSNNSNMQNIALHYVAIIIPFVFLAAIYGVKKLLTKYHLSTRLVAILLTIAALVGGYFFGPLPLAKNQDIYPLFWPRSETKHLDYWKEQFKDEKLIISASDSLGAHFTDRQYFYIFSEHYSLADYVILRIDDIKNHVRKEEIVKIYEKLKSDPKFKLIFNQDGLEVYKKI